MLRALYIASTALGFILLLLSGIYPWFEIPKNADFQGASNTEALYRIFITILTLILIFQILIRKEFSRERISHTLNFLILFLFVFPFLQQYFSPNLLAKASWLNIQHENLSWLGGDVYTTQEYTRYNFKNKLLVVDSPRDIATFPLPYLNSDTFSLGTISEALSWAGFSNHFCQFAKKGYFLAWLGTLLLSLLLCRQNEVIDLKLIKKNLKQTCLLLSCSAGVILTLVASTSFFISKAENDAKKGYYLSSKRNLLRASSTFPLIAKNSSFILQLGLLDLKLNQNSPYSQIYQAKSFIDRAQGYLAEELLLGLIEGTSSTNREARRLLTRVSIDKINSNQIADARNILDKVLYHEPDAIKANYIAQLVTLRESDIKKLRGLVARQKQTYQSFNTKGKKTVLASANENLAFLELQESKLDQALETWRNRGSGK